MYVILVNLGSYCTLPCHALTYDHTLVIRIFKSQVIRLLARMDSITAFC